MTAPLDPDPLGPGPRRKLTEKQRAHYRFFHDQMMQFEWDLRHAVWQGLVLPGEWHEVLKAGPKPEKTRVTIRLDADLVRFFRALGPGWQTQLNRVVRAFVMARLAGIVEGPESLDAALEGLHERPALGTSERMMADLAQLRADAGLEGE